MVVVPAMSVGRNKARHPPELMVWFGVDMQGRLHIRQGLITEANWMACEQVDWKG